MAGSTDMLARLALPLALAAALIVPAAASAAPTLSAPAYAELVRIDTALDTAQLPADGSAPDFTQYCQPAPDAAADQQTQLVYQRCTSLAVYLKSSLDSIGCAIRYPHAKQKVRAYRCLAKVMHSSTKALRSMIAVENELGAGVEGDCRTYFIGYHASYAALIKAEDRYAEVLATGDKKKIKAGAKAFSKAIDKIPDSDDAETAALLRTCDPSPPTPAVPAPAPTPPPAA
jgi:hypothetical protein